MLTIYTFFPLIVISLVPVAVMAESDWLPVWFIAASLPLSHSIEFAVYTLGLVWMFSKFERSIIFDADEQRSVLRRVVTSTVASVMFLLASSMTGFEIDFRELSQDYSLNIVYNIVRVLIIFFYFGIYGSSRSGIFILGVGIGFFNAFSGSKASMLTPILIAMMILGRLNLKVFFIVLMVVAAGLLGLIPLHYFVRYLDPGLSAYQTAYIYYDSSNALIDYHLAAVWNAVSGGRGYNPVVEYLNDTGLAAGYNLTPTIVGEMMGSGRVVGLIILSLVFFLINTARHIWVRRGKSISKTYLPSYFFVILGVTQSSLLDLIFYNVYFFISIFLLRLIKINIDQKNA